MKMNISISVPNNGGVVVHDGDSTELPWRFREILVVGSDGEKISDLPRCVTCQWIQAITNETFSNLFWSRIRSR